MTERNLRRISALAMAILLPVVGLMSQSAQAASGHLELKVVDKETGKPVACRIHLYGPNNDKPRRADNAPYWQDHFVINGKISLKVPLGGYTFLMDRGLEYLQQDGHFTISAFADDSKKVELTRFIDMAKEGWWSADFDVRRPMKDIEVLMLAEDLHLVEVLSTEDDKPSTGDKSTSGGKSSSDAKAASSDKKTSNDKKISGEKSPPAKTPAAAKSLPKQPLTQFDGNRFCHLTAGAQSCPGGEVLLLNQPEAFKPEQIEGEYPPLAKIIREAKQRNDVWVDVSRPFWWDLPVLVALGQVDSIQIAHGDICREKVIPHETGGLPRDKVHYPNPFGNPEWSQFIYFQLLECGLRIPPSAGSGSGVSPNPVGYNRMYVHVDGEFTYEKWWQSFKSGAVFVTNGPLMRPYVNGELPGHVFTTDPEKKLYLQTSLTISVRDPITYLEIIKNGKIEETVRFNEYAKDGRLPVMEFDDSGWFLIRAVTDVGKTYRFAMTAPFYVEVGYKPRVSKKAAQFFLDWVNQREKQIKLDDPKQQEEVMDYYRQAREFWRDKVSKATAE